MPQNSTPQRVTHTPPDPVRVERDLFRRYYEQETDFICALAPALCEWGGGAYGPCNGNLDVKREGFVAGETPVVCVGHLINSFGGHPPDRPLRFNAVGRR